MKTFVHDGELYIRVIPAKTLCRSSLIYQVITRGDIFAIRAKDSVLTIIPGLSQVTHHEHELIDKRETSTAGSKVKRTSRVSSNKQAADEFRKKQRTLFG